MPAFGILVIVIGVWILVNTFNGNLTDVIEGKAKFNLGSSSTSTTSSGGDTTQASHLNQTGIGNIAAAGGTSIQDNAHKIVHNLQGL